MYTLENFLVFVATITGVCVVILKGVPSSSRYKPKLSNTHLNINIVELSHPTKVKNINFFHFYTVLTFILLVNRKMTNRVMCTSNT